MFWLGISTSCTPESDTGRDPDPTDDAASANDAGHAADRGDEGWANADALVRAEEIYVECLAGYGLKVTKLNLSPGDYDVQFEPGDYTDGDVAAALIDCEAQVERFLEDAYVEEIPFEDLPHDDFMVPMRDGTRLATRVFYPEGDGPWPSIVHRTPYNHLTDVVNVTAYLSFGIAVVEQDLRGRFASEGRDAVFTTDGDGELQDGYDTLSWVTEQPFSNGLIATEGISAPGIVSYLQLVTQPPGLRAARADVATANLYDSVFPGGVFRQGLVESWLSDQGSEFFLDAYKMHPFEDEFWASQQVKDVYGRGRVPMLHVSGWFDIFTQDTINAFLGFQHEGGEGARGKQKLIIGPWVHGNLGNSPDQGELNYPEQSLSAPISRDSVYAAMLSEAFSLDEPINIGAPLIAFDDVPAIQYYVMGDVHNEAAPGNEWRSTDDWPPPAAQTRLYLHEDGELSETCPEGGNSTYTFDPEDPSPTLCGANLYLNSGPCDQRELEGRTDTLVFSTPILSEPQEITGRLSAHLVVDIDQVDTDLMVRITDVYPDGSSILLTEGAQRIAARRQTDELELVDPGELIELSVDLPSTSIVINRGHRLRVAVTSSNAPRFQVNRNNGLHFGDMADGPAHPVRVRLHHEPGAASYVTIPRPDLESAPGETCP